MDNSSKLIIEFTLVYNRYKSGVYYYVYKMLHKKMLVEDIVQNVFIRLFENYDLIRNKEAIAAWIYKTARNEIYAHLRSKKDNSVSFEEEEHKSEGDIIYQLENKELREIVNIELSYMPDEQREIYVLKEYSGLSYKEIAEIQDIDEDLVKSRLFKVRQKLIKKISKLV